MLIVRETFTAKPGQASKLAKLMKKMFANEPGVQVMTDLISHYNTVVVQMAAASLGEWEQRMEDYKSGKFPMDPALAEEWKGYTELWVAGKREIFQVVE